jgi:hypothetical protein
MSEWKKGASDRRDERNIKDENDVPKHSSKKNKKNGVKEKWALNISLNASDIMM